MQKLSLPSHPSNHFRLSLRTWLFIFSLLAMLPLLLFAIHTINRISNAQTESVLRNLQRQSKILTHSTQNELDAAFSALQMLASGAEINRTALPRLYRHAKNVVQDNPAFTAITLTDANEQLLFHSDAPLEKSNLKTNDLELTEPVFKNGRPNLSSLSGTSQNGRPVVILSAPISQGDKLAYCLRLYLGLESFDRLLANELLPSGWVAVIVDAKARVIARSLEANDFFTPNTLSDLLSASPHNDGRLSETTTLNGTVMTTLVRTLPGVNWRLAVAVPTQQMNAPRLQLLRELMLLTGMWLTLSFLLSQILATYLLRQLKRITSMVEKNSDPSVIRLRINESWQFIQTIAINQRNAQRVKDNLSDTSRQRDEVHALYEQAPCGYYSIDTEGRIIRINQTLILWLGYQLHEMLGYKSSDFLAGDGRDAFKQNFSTLLAQKKLKNQERVFIRKDGSEMPALISAEVVFDDAGQVVLIRAVVFDNTERKLAQQTLADARAREMETGRQIQLTLLSTPQLSAYAGLWLSTFSQASRGVDGDFLDVVAVGDHLLDIVAGDVMGKGVPAALMGAAIKLQFSRSKSELFGQRDTRENPPQPAEIVTAVNRAIAPQLQVLGAFATLIYLRIDTQENLSRIQV
ncbi:PAS domain S-box protein [Polaromonas vacuolata]|nr:PAS domain S-box protein [Polaromonas vacuolata]